MSNQEQQHTPISTLGEFGLIDRLTADLVTRQASTLRGVGDDAAVVSAGKEALVITTDLLVEGIHFDLMYHPLRHLGYKAVIVNLSDVCAMNAVPQQIIVSMGLSNRFSVEAAEELYAGIRTACEHYNVDLVGGDTTSSNKGLILSITAMGRVPAQRLAYRSGASPGDLICISGDLGAAYLGLQILEREKQIYLSQGDAQGDFTPDLEGQDYLIGRQLKPEARTDIVNYLHDHGILPTAMIDLSDGLSSDLMHLCRSSQVGAFIEEANVPVRQEAELMAIKFKMDPITCALSGGEDYELLFTARPEDLPKLKVMPDIYISGEIVEESAGVTLHTSGGKVHPLTAQGWTHF